MNNSHVVTLTTSIPTCKSAIQNSREGSFIRMAMTVTEDGEWKRADDDDYIYKFTTEYAKSSRATCKLCSEKIKKDTVRVGTPVKWSGGSYGYINAWQHLICARNNDGEEITKDEIWGIEDLKDSDQQDLLAELQKKGLPSHIKTIDPNDKNFLKKRSVPAMDQPSKIEMALMPYQLEGVGWMINAEKSHVRGGILADEMGMGKTLQAISLILATRNERKTIVKKTLQQSKINALNAPVSSSCCHEKNEGDCNVGDKRKKSTSSKKKKKNSTQVPTTPRKKKTARKKRSRKKSEDSDYDPQEDDEGAFTPQSRKNYATSKNKKSSSKKKGPLTDSNDKNGASTYPELNTALATLRTEDVQEFGPTLVVCPSSAMLQWRDEIYRCSVDGSVKVFLYYQDRKKIKPRDLLKYDVVLTTYAVLEYDYRKQVNKQKVPCEYCNKLYLPRKLVLHNQYFCGPNAMRTLKQQKTERTKKSALEKAKVTLKITKKKSNKTKRGESGVEKKSRAKKKAKMPTPTAIYRELMQDANREAVPMYVSTKKGQNEVKAKEASPETRTGNKIEKSTTTLSRSLSRLKDTLTPGTMDPAPSPVDNTTLETPRRKRFTRKAAKTSPYFSGRKSGSSKTSNTKRIENEGSSKKSKTLYVDESDEDDCSSKKKRKSKAQMKSTKKRPESKSKRRSKSNQSSTDESSEDDSTDESSSSSSDDDDIDDADFTDRDGVNLKKSTLHRTKWLRVILDEAHKIKGRTNNTAKSVYALKSSYRWCLTGTPLQNRVSELYALIRFLVLAPHSYYFCSKEGCDCISLYWEFGPKSRICTKCGHPPMRHYSFFNKKVMNPIKRYGYIGEGRRAMLRLKQDILDVVMLRRTKVERAEDIKLPPLEINVETLKLNESERDFYECIYKNSRSKFDTYVNKGTLLNNYAHVFQLLSRLRQTLDHPYLVVHGDFQGQRQNLPSKSTGHSDVCGICGFDIQKSRECVLSACHHTFHKSCLDEYTKEFNGESDDDAAENSLSDTKKKKRKRRLSTAKKSKRKSLSNVMTCPVCFIPLTIQLGEVRGLDETSDSSSLLEDDSTKCIVCMENDRNALLVPCGHIYTCKSCTDVFRKRKNACPICRSVIRKVIVQDKASKIGARMDSAKVGSSSNSSASVLLGQKSIVQQLTMDNFESSSKVEAVVKHVKELAKTKGNKGIIFSQYNRMIDIVEWRLKDAGYNVVKLVGSMSLKQRGSVLQKFKTDPDIHIIIMSLKAGGEGLNLQEASHVFVLEPWWNPAVELQAIQRAHRIGQTKTVKAFRFITEDTIEERMSELQEKKQLVFEGTIDSSALALSQLTTDDLRFLFK